MTKAGGFNASFKLSDEIDDQNYSRWLETRGKTTETADGSDVDAFTRSMIEKAGGLRIQEQDYDDFTQFKSFPSAVGPEPIFEELKHDQENGCHSSPTENKKDLR